MEKIIETIANKLNLSTEEIKEKFKLPENYTFKHVSDAIGAFSVFSSKEDYEKHLNHKLTKKNEEIRVINEQLTIHQKNLETLKNENDLNKKYAGQVRDLVEAEWNNLGIKRPFEKANVNLENLDFTNLNKSILDFATTEGFAISKETNNQEKQTEQTGFKPKEISFFDFAKPGEYSKN